MQEEYVRDELCLPKVDVVSIRSNRSVCRSAQCVGGSEKKEKSVQGTREETREQNETRERKLSPLLPSLLHEILSRPLLLGRRRLPGLRSSAGGDSHEQTLRVRHGVVDEGGVTSNGDGSLNGWSLDLLGLRSDEGRRGLRGGSGREVVGARGGKSSDGSRSGRLLNDQSCCRLR